MPYEVGTKIKLIKDHNNKDLKRPRYGYIVVAMEATKATDGFYTELDKTTTGMVYLIQTSWCSGMLWYTENAFKPAKGRNELREWQAKLVKWNESHS